MVAKVFKFSIKNFLCVLSSPDMTTVDMQLPVMEMVMTFQLVDRPPPVPSMVDILAIAMGRLLPAMDMDIYC